EITGKVSYQGKLLTFGTVRIMDCTGHVQTATILADGSYRFEKVPAGPATLVVSSFDPTGPQRLREAVSRKDGPKTRAQSAPPGVADNKGQKSGQLSLIPLEYGDFSKARIKRTVASGVNLFDLDLN